MHSLFYPLILQMIPSSILFYIGIEIYLRYPGNRLHQLTMVMFLFLSLLFFGDFLTSVLPLETVAQAFYYVKYPSVFVTVTITLYFFQSIGRWNIDRKWRHLIALPPLAMFVAVLVRPGWLQVYLHFNGNWREETFNAPFAILLASIIIYTFFWSFFFLVSAFRRMKDSRVIIKERRRIRVMLIGCIATFVYLVVAVGINILLKKLHFPTLYSLPSFCMLIWAFTIRYAMIKFDFLASAGRRYELLYELSPDGIVLLDEQKRIIDANSAFLKIIGLEDTSQVDMKFTSLFPAEEKERFLSEYDCSFRQLQPFQFETELYNAAGERYFIQMKCDYLEIDGQILTLFVMQDITEQKKHEELLSRLAYQDELTSLDNRRQFREKLQKELDASAVALDKLAVMLIDLDQFKWINDTLGHSAGDILLEQAARRLEEGHLPDGVVARLGGDEFAVLLPHIEDDKQVTKFATKIKHKFEKPFVIYGKSYKVTVSIGISMSPYDGHDVETLLRNADTAMYVAKQKGRNQYYWFTEKFKTQADQHLTLANGLSHALAEDELLLYYQPQMDMENDKVFGVEALLRWKSKELGEVSPAVFIPIAEETGSILPIGAWVLRTAVKQAKRWVDEGYEDLVVSVNLSAHQLREADFAIYVSDMLQEFGVPARNLCLEITESAAISDVDTSFKVCQELVELGISLAIDDFGVGHSSLSMLNKFPFQFIKLDRSLVQDIVTSSRDYSVIRTVIELSGHLGMQVVAEGVETMEQAELLRELKCPEAQGYLFGKPMPLEEISRYLREHVKRT